MDVRDVTLVGFSMGGGEVARYAGHYGANRLGGIVFVSAMSTFLRKTINNPDGVEPAVFDELAKALAHDRPAFLQSFLADFFHADEPTGRRLSEPDVQFAWHEAVTASPLATRALVEASSGTDFRIGQFRRVRSSLSKRRRTLIWTHAARFNAAAGLSARPVRPRRR